MSTATLTTPAVSCMSCMATIEDALAPVVGVEAADVDLAAKQVRVTFDETLVAPADLARAISNAGYEVTDISA